MKKEFVCTGNTCSRTVVVTGNCDISHLICQLFLVA